VTLHSSRRLAVLCGEPGCHLGLFDERIDEDVSEHIRRAMHLRQPLAVYFVRVGVNYHPGIGFHYGLGDA